jgi:hypothetical protein
VAAVANEDIYMTAGLPHDRLYSLLYYQLPRSVVYWYVASLVALYVFVRVHVPITVYKGSPHDDTLFMRLGESIASGHWLGKFDEFTLMKGPGFPAFLALNNWLGIPVSLSIALFHCFAVTFFVVICHRFVKSLLLSGLLFTLLLWHPLPLSVFLSRIFRDSIYYAEALLVLATLIGALFYPTEERQRLLFASFSGAALGWFWLTREEGVWILPAVLLLTAIATVRAIRSHQVRELARSLMTALLVFVALQAGFRTANWFAYGSFVGVDFKEANFQRALKMIHSVRSGGILPWVSITREARARVYEISPSFALLKKYLDGPSGEDWARISCAAMENRTPCSEIGAGHFMWALRSAASSNNFYASPDIASKFYARMADEISRACDKGLLECVRQPIAEMPPVTWQEIKDTFRYGLFVRAADLLLLLDPPLHIEGSDGSETELSRLLRFLNFPRFEKQAGTDPSVYTLSGWYFRGDRTWIRVMAKHEDGQSADVHMDRNDSPDLVAAFKNAQADQQRFQLEFPCDRTCFLVIETSEGEKVEKRVTELLHGAAFKIGEGQLYVDWASSEPVGYKTLPERLSLLVRGEVLRFYQFAWIPVLLIGTLAFIFASVFYWKEVAWDVCYALALASWLLVFSRVALLLGMAIVWTSPVILTETYASPAYFHLVCAAVLSIAALAHVSHSAGWLTQKISHRS